MSIRASTDLFRQIPLFAACEETHLQLLAFTSERVTLRPGEPILRAGDQSHAAYLILTGAADVWVKEDKLKKTVAIIGPGALAGELAMIAGIAYSANITATDEVTAIRVTRDVFMRVAQEFPDFGIRIHQTLAERLNTSMSEINRVRRMFDGSAGISLPG